jgi:ABC-type lipoprotein export system ATPase subunit
MINIIGGYGKDGERDLVDELIIKPGEIVSIVGPTGSGKTNLIRDIELCADKNTPSKRRVIIDNNGSSNCNHVAMITQHTNFLADMPVYTFLEIHAKVRGSCDVKPMVDSTLTFANKLTGEPIDSNSDMTELSGGQTRALLIADAVVLGNSPIVLLDEIENAGIDKSMAIRLLKQFDKTIIFVTHDPRIALLSDFRIVMKNGAIQKVLGTSDKERLALKEIEKIDELVSDVRHRIRSGLSIEDAVKI